MNISEAAARTGVPAKTIRYYEDIGLVAPGRGPNGYRRFGETEVQKLAFVGRARSLGFTVDECRRLLALYEDRSRASADVKRLATEHLRDIDRKLSELQGMRTLLAHLIEKCHGDDRPACPIIDELSGGRH
jgi:MerR family copper efflux transcriptional regulator